MADKILVNYPALEDMAKHCQRVANELDAAADFAKRMSAKMQDGALVGKPGDTFAEALGQLEQRTKRFSEKLVEIVRDINLAISDMQAADSDVTTKL